ncbi:hypothetical protein P3X46_010037 [Hevea brasiliensis]|uniref:non-specific serine/threonine protein kinase n=1 Tax=Hevea brasiliensis TaxID=3981 RepID=A0ABQ9MCT6_HEVBR|nr:probable serine/threonine-protein kinase PBL28 [Hevea brasiliensis]XP_058004237.1 probable serine/threonine-protein kinase PBL28 [Hevea brasiliensis]XP_058004238.1 probable serine/threonine-protein kinase PBL28 [Hevea brasiliensis]KAJ9178127.1 hypothetical protein P3X46_010037 [Hevea brasiliensis]
MHLFWWQQLPLLILIQLLEPNSTSHKLSAEALVACKSTNSRLQHSIGKIGRYSCLRQWASANCYKLNDPGVVYLSPRRHPPFLQTGFIKSSPVALKFISSKFPIELQEKVCKSSNRRIAAAVDGDNGVPTLTPLQEADAKKPSKHKVAFIIGGVGAALLVIVIVVVVYVCLMHAKKFLRQASETASSIPSPPVELARSYIPPSAAAQSPFNTQLLRQLSIVELEHATCNFSHSNIIGEGVFGLVYKGLLLDGSIVAIKRCLHKPVLNFVAEVKRMASVHHKHLVELIGYCEDRHQQLLVYDYISNGNVGNYLNDSEGLPIGKLDMRQRLSIALGAAKGLQYLHSLVPPFLHMHFRTSNVLLGDNFTAKVSDYGLLNLVMEGHSAGPSSATDYFRDPELNLSNNFSERSDVYSFGVFLLELVSGREAHGKYQSNSGHNLVEEARECRLGDFIDKILGVHTMQAAGQMMELALHCVDISRKRPSMVRVVQEIEQIHRREMGFLQPEFGEEIGSVTLGSELFK